LTVEPFITSSCGRNIGIVSETYHYWSPAHCLSVYWLSCMVSYELSCMLHLNLSNEVRDISYLVLKGYKMRWDISEMQPSLIETTNN